MLLKFFMFINALVEYIFAPFYYFLQQVVPILNLTVSKRLLEMLLICLFYNLIFVMIDTGILHTCKSLYFYLLKRSDTKLFLKV